MAQLKKAQKELKANRIHLKYLCEQLNENLAKETVDVALLKSLIGDFDTSLRNFDECQKEIQCLIDESELENIIKEYCDSRQTFVLVKLKAMDVLQLEQKSEISDEINNDFGKGTQNARFPKL